MHEDGLKRRNSFEESFVHKLSIMFCTILYEHKSKSLIFFTPIDQFLAANIFVLFRTRVINLTFY